MKEARPPGLLLSLKKNAGCVEHLDPPRQRAPYAKPVDLRLRDLAYRRKRVCKLSTGAMHAESQTTAHERVVHMAI